MRWDDQVKSHHLTFWQLRPRVCQQDSSCQVNQEWRKRTEPREVCARNQAAPINKTQQNTVWKCLKCIRIFRISYLHWLYNIPPFIQIANNWSSAESSTTIAGGGKCPHWNEYGYNSCTTWYNQRGTSEIDGTRHSTYTQHTLHTSSHILPGPALIVFRNCPSAAQSVSGSLQ